MKWVIGILVVLGVLYALLFLASVIDEMTGHDD